MSKLFSAMFLQLFWAECNMKINKTFIMYMLKKVQVQPALLLDAFFNMKPAVLTLHFIFVRASAE